MESLYNKTDILTYESFSMKQEKDPKKFKMLTFNELKENCRKILSKILLSTPKKEESLVKEKKKPIAVPLLVRLRRKNKGRMHPVFLLCQH